jgi:hypothetical protein
MVSKMTKSIYVILMTIFLVSCSNTAQESQKQTQILMDYALYDFPLPADSEIQMDNTVILGSGDMWAGQILMYSAFSPVELINYFTETGNSSNWLLASSTISEKVLLVFNKDNRIATVEISTGKKSLLSISKTKVKISINHPNSINTSSGLKQSIQSELDSVESELDSVESELDSVESELESG